MDERIRKILATDTRNLEPRYKEILEVLESITGPAGAMDPFAGTIDANREWAEVASSFAAAGHRR